MERTEDEIADTADVSRINELIKDYELDISEVLASVKVLYSIRRRTSSISTSKNLNSVRLRYNDVTDCIADFGKAIMDTHLGIAKIIKYASDIIGIDSEPLLLQANHVTKKWAEFTPSGIEEIIEKNTDALYTLHDMVGIYANDGKITSKEEATRGLSLLVRAANRLFRYLISVYTGATRLRETIEYVIEELENSSDEEDIID